MPRHKLLVIDGMALLFRAFYATAPSGQYMFNEQGIPTNGVQGFLRHLLLAVQYIQPSHLAVCWDTGAKTFRHHLYEAYKANRPAPPVELVPQFEMARRMADALGAANLSMTGFEADDCIGTLSRLLSNQLDIRIVTGDRDLLQLLTPEVQVNLLQKGYGNYRVYTATRFEEDMGISPAQFIDVKALMGDASDGYPGVHGIGEKTALKLIQRFGTIETLLHNLSEIPDGQRKKIETDQHILQLSRRLAAIRCDLSLEFDIKDAIYNDIPDLFTQHVRDYGLKLVQVDLLRMRQADRLQSLHRPSLN
ncbi:MAG: 5'-3' exonuclease [Sporolactobacillus sp.]